MGNDADWTQTAAGDVYGGPRRGGKRYFDAYTDAVSQHGAKSPEANRAINDAISHGWSVSGITQAIQDRQGGNDRSGSDRRGGPPPGLKGPNSPPVDQ